jgi:hypothetical protein
MCSFRWGLNSLVIKLVPSFRLKMLNRQIASRRFLPFLREVLMIGWVRRVWAAVNSAYCLPLVLPPRVMSLKWMRKARVSCF